MGSRFLFRSGFILAVAVVALAGCGGRTTDTSTPREYLDHALALLEANAVGGARRIDWLAVRAEAHRLAAQAKRVTDDYPAITYAVDAVRASGDPHAMFFTAADWAFVRGGTGLTPQAAVPSVGLRDGILGKISLPELTAAPSAPSARRYERVALSAIAAVERSRPCGWIVDLRYDGGGDMYPMLLAVGPILGEGPLVGFAAHGRLLGFVSYRHTALVSDYSGVRNTYPPPLNLADIRPLPPVAVLIGSGTVSAGEAVAIAFRGRRLTRFFGSPTAGATNSPRAFHLRDGVVLFFGVARDLDRNHAAYTGPIAPAVAADEGVPERAEQLARRWLLSQPSCTGRH